MKKTNKQEKNNKKKNRRRRPGDNLRIDTPHQGTFFRETHADLFLLWVRGETTPRGEEEGDELEEADRMINRKRVIKGKKKKERVNEMK